MESSGNGFVKIGELERRMFMLLLQQKFLTFDLLLKWFEPGHQPISDDRRPKLYYRLYRLVRAGFLRKQSCNESEFYFLAPKGLEAITDLNFRKLALVGPDDMATLAHDLAVAHVRHYLESIGATEWVADREFRLHAAELAQVPDGACTINGLIVFIEVELTQKSAERYESIAAVYTREKGPNRVLYFYSNPSVVAYLRKKTAHHERVGFFPYEAPLKRPYEIEGVCGARALSLGEFLGLEAEAPHKDPSRASIASERAVSDQGCGASRECPRCGYLIPKL